MAQYIFQKVVIFIHSDTGNTGKIFPVFAGIIKSHIPENRLNCHSKGGPQFGPLSVWGSPN
jgi:hypothetical protein